MLSAITLAGSFAISGVKPPCLKAEHCRPGTTGAVGEALLETLAERQFPVGEIYALARNESAGEQLRFGGKTITVQDAAEFDWTQAQLAFLSQAKKLPQPGLKKRPTQVAR